MLCFGLQETTLSCGSALYRSQSPGKSECVFTVKRSPSWHAKSAQSQPNLPARPTAAGSHAKSTRRTALARFATAGDYNRRPPQPQPGQLALYQRHSAFGAAPRARQGGAPRVRQAIGPHALGALPMRVGALHTCPKRRAQTGRATYARRGATRQNSGQNLVEGFAGAGVGVDRAG